jgi:hypothetical protein
MAVTIPYRQLEVAYGEPTADDVVLLVVLPAAVAATLSA